MTLSLLLLIFVVKGKKENGGHLEYPIPRLPFKPPSDQIKLTNKCSDVSTVGGLW